MKSITKKELRELKLVELDILKEFDRICRKHNLKYVLVGGTLIGAIRHKGFIPWDDDIDVDMPREDYNKFIEIQKKELDNKKYYFQSMETDEEYGLPFAKLRRKNSIYAEITSPLDLKKQGIWIDVFPIDYISDNKIMQFFTFIKIFYYKTLYSFKCNFKFNSKGIKKIILSVIKFISRFYSKEYVKKRFYNSINKCNRKKTHTLVSHGGVYLLKEIINEEYITQRIVGEFEENEFFIPKYYDDFLKRMYGNYMELPPKEKQISQHLTIKLQLPNK